MSANTEQTQLGDSYHWYTGFMPPDPVNEAEIRTEIVQDLGSRYQVEEFLGQGAFASVWKAVDSITGERVAIKRFHVQLKTENSFYRELRTLFGLQHPHIVRVINLMESPAGHRYLVFEYCAGGNLRAALSYARNHQHCWPPERIRQIAREITLALGFAHRQGIIHRDLKPENILFHTAKPELFGGELKLADFGLACGLSLARRKSESFDASRQLSGSPAYMAPEQFGGAMYPASDFYALGVILYELWHQQLPFCGAPEELAYHHLNTQATIAPELPEAWKQLLQQLLTKDPQTRLADAEAVLASLLAESTLEQIPAPAAEAGCLRPHWSRCCSLPPLGVTLWQPQGEAPEVVTAHAAGSFHAPLEGTRSHLVPRAGCKAVATQPDGTLWLSAQQGVFRWSAEETQPQLVCPTRLCPFLVPDSEEDCLIGVQGDSLVSYHAGQLRWQTKIERLKKTLPPLVRLTDSTLVCAEEGSQPQIRMLSPNGETLQERPLPGPCRQLIADNQACWAKIWQADRFQIAKLDHESVTFLPSSEGWVWMAACLPLNTLIAATDSGKLFRLGEDCQPLAELELSGGKLRTFAVWDSVLAVLAKHDASYWLHTFLLPSLS